MREINTNTHTHTHTHTDTHTHARTHAHTHTLTLTNNSWLCCKQAKMLTKKPCNRPKDPQFWYYNVTSEVRARQWKLMRETALLLA